MRREKVTPGKYSHPPKSERPTFKDSKATRDAKTRKSVEIGSNGPARKKQKFGDRGDITGKTEGKAKKVQASQSQAIVPFDVHDNILLVGEGDLSFTSSLLLDHGCASITSTTFDDAATLLTKYPHAAEHVKTIEDTEQSLLHSIDATKLHSYKLIKQRAPWDKIIFNFPHIGGKYTDVNRQVRANQELLTGFLGSAKGLLNTEREEGDGAPEGKGTILITLFEGEPYSLWNIRDLARHCGLVVRRSWKFQRSVFPGYKHARTLGVVLKKGGDAEGEVSETAWKGEEREARTYEFGVKVEEDWREKRKEMKREEKKRRRRGSDDDSDDD